jgi:kinesin family protein 11
MSCFAAGQWVVRGFAWDPGEIEPSPGTGPPTRRPLSDKEIAERTPQVISCNEALREATLYIQGVGGKQTSKTFRFDRASRGRRGPRAYDLICFAAGNQHCLRARVCEGSGALPRPGPHRLCSRSSAQVFSPEASQEKLFKQAIVPIVQEVMEGFNCTIFAYGQTGTGKTYTMEGGPRRSDDGKALSPEAGVIPRSIKQIFDTIEANNTDSTVKVTFLELYNEELTDLLSTFDDGKEDAKRLRLLEDRSGVVVQGLEEVVVKSAAEIYQVRGWSAVRMRRRLRQQGCLSRLPWSSSTANHAVCDAPPLAAPRRRHPPP